MKTVKIFPYFDAFNQSFYLYCLKSVFGARNIDFTTDGFPKVMKSGSLKLIIQGAQGARQKRIIIDHWDLPVFDMEALEWCDVYAKRNIDPNSFPQKYADKIVPSGPSFPLRAANMAQSAYYALRTFWLISGRSVMKDGLNRAQMREHFANWGGLLLHRLPPDAYKPGRSSRDYIFFCANLWKKDGAANDARAMFIRASKSLPGMRFEGGFARRHDIDAHKDLMIDQWYTQRQFVEKTIASAVVFNNPAVARCHSWRLGEALALGKAIVSLPIERMLPAPLVHGKDVHYVEPSIQSIAAAVRLIAEDEGYRTQLERGAREYFLRQLSPAAVVERIQGLAPILFA